MKGRGFIDTNDMGNLIRFDQLGGDVKAKPTPERVYSVQLTANTG